MILKIFHSLWTSRTTMHDFITHTHVERDTWAHLDTVHMPAAKASTVWWGSVLTDYVST